MSRLKQASVTRFRRTFRTSTVNPSLCTVSPPRNRRSPLSVIQSLKEVLAETPVARSGRLRTSRSREAACRRRRPELMSRRADVPRQAVEFVLDVADQLLENVFLRDHAAT